MSKKGSKPAGAHGEVAGGSQKAADTRLVAPIGQGALLQWTLRAARSLRMHHALVIAGPPGSGKSTIARWIAGALLCPSDLDDEQPCGVCRTCRRVQTGQFPDLHIVGPEPDKREITVDPVRELLSTLSRHPVEGRARVAILDPASSLNTNAQNALLKTLEEPRKDTFVLMCASNPDALLPTVRSRSERLGALRLADDAILAELSRRAPEREPYFAKALAMARGSLGRALDACTEHAVQVHDLVAEVCAANKPLRPVAMARRALSVVEGVGSAQSNARAFLAALRDEASAHLRALASPDGGSYVAKESHPWTELMTLSLSAEQDLDLQIPPEQALVGLLVQWQRRRNGR